MALVALGSMVVCILLAINAHPSVFALIPAFAAGLCFGMAVWILEEE